MSTNEELKRIVREKYGEIAEQSSENTSCCEPGASSCCGSDDDLKIFSMDYSSLQGYNPDADLGLGCGLPTEFAKLQSGDTVVDLGSGAGNDCFIARQIVGPEGKVIGVDMTPNMIDKARANAKKLNLNNVEFRLGEIENLPVKNEEADVVISNCVLNLVPDKKSALEETFRILKGGGHFSVSDIVTYSEIPEGLRKEAALYAGCVSGALIKEDYIKMIEDAGFENIKIQKEQKMNLPDSLLEKYLDVRDVERYKNEFAGIASITVYGEKPCCSGNSNCC
ncbi:MAG: arsenite methyltransferase [Cytophagales bacterium]|nr:arsenite methyltransferase [Cytophagales bacterium]